MAYITISIILLILFLDVGLQIEHNNNTKIYLLISSLKIKLNLKSFDRFIEEASHKTSKENVDNFKKNLSLVKPIKHIMAGATIDYIDIIRFDDFTDIKLISPFLTYNGYYLINDLINELFFIVKKWNYLYYPFNEKRLIFNLKARINLFKLIKILLQEIFVIIGGKIYEQSRRFFKGKSRRG